MKRKVLALIMPLVLLVPSLNSISVNADNYVDYGTIQVTIIDEETQELFNEDRYCFSVTGSGMHLDSWNPAESNPHTITDVQKQFKYMVQYIAKDYDGYTYYIDAEKSEPLISFADDDVKEVTVYMKKNIWGSSTTNPETPDSTELKTFEELYALKENELKQYCSDHKINYISPEEAKNQIANKCGINIMVKPNDYLMNADGDLLESEDLSAFKKSNFADYDFNKMVSDLQYPESDYKFDSAKNDFAFYLVSEPDNSGNPKKEYLKLAQIHIDISIANSNRSSERLYQLMAIWAEQNSIVYTVSLEKVGASSAAEEEKTGDVNNDGEFNISDVVLLQKWLLAVPDTHLANWKAVDFCADNKLDVFDLCLMKRALLYGGTVQSDTDLKTKFPEYYDQETFKGLEVYLWQETDGGYKCGLLMGTNRNKTDEEIIALTNNGATIEEMKVILSSYSINDDMIAIIPIRISEASYEIMESDFESVRKMFWGADSVEPVSIAGKIFAYEKEGVGGYCTLSFNENGRFLYSPGKMSSYMDGGDWKVDGDTVSLIGMENKTIYLKITDDTLVYIAEGSDEFPYMDIKDGEKFVIYRPEISADKFQLNSRYSEYGLGDPKVELDLIVSELPEFCYVEDVRLYDEDDNFIGMMSPAMDADIWNYLVDCHVTEECSKTYYTLSKIRCGGKTYLDDVRSEITVNFKATPAP